jgi:hypothetical protein
MNKRVIILLIALVMLIGVSGSLFADPQVDIGINFPAYIGVAYQGERASEQLPFSFPVPDLMYNYYFGFDFISVGVGFRAWSLILASAAYPIVSAQVQLDPIVLQANVGGGAFVYHVIGAGLGFETGNVFFPEISAAFKFNDWFSLGASVLGIYLPDLTDEGMGFTVNVFTRFRVVD